MSDESELVIFLPKMVQQQREPDDQSRGSDDDGQGNQSQILFAENKQELVDLLKKKKKYCKVLYMDTAQHVCMRKWQGC